MPRYVVTLEAYITASSPEDAENKYHEGGYKSYVIQVDEVGERDTVPPLNQQEGWFR
jgi:hypothetical protein